MTIYLEEEDRVQEELDSCLSKLVQRVSRKSWLVLYILEQPKCQVFFLSLPPYSFLCLQNRMAHKMTKQLVIGQ